MFSLIPIVTTSLINIVWLIIGTKDILTSRPIPTKFKIKEIFKKYCEKHNLNIMCEISDYHKWANLHEIELDKKELEDVLL